MFLKSHFNAFKRYQSFLLFFFFYIQRSNNNILSTPFSVFWPISIRIFIFLLSNKHPISLNSIPILPFLCFHLKIKCEKDFIHSSRYFSSFIHWIISTSYHYTLRTKPHTHRLTHQTSLSNYVCLLRLLQQTWFSFYDNVI